MTAQVFSKPSDVTAAPVRDAGGDNEVPRDSKGRPRILVRCSECRDPYKPYYTGTPGKVTSPKTMKPIKCSKCAGEGQYLRSYTRTTTYIDVLTDKSNLEAWQMRMVLLGVSRDPKLLDGVEELYQEQRDAEDALRRLEPEERTPERVAELKAAAKKPKDALTRKAEVAKEKAGAEEKADKGTQLHALSELVDLGQELPTQGVSFEDVLDLHAYRCATEGFHIVHMEKLVVNDELKIGGTPDRISEWRGNRPLIAPDGTVFEPNSGERFITDLKTGTTDYGGLKMAMQLGIYAHSELYDHETGDRMPIEGINKAWGVIMNVPAGGGVATLYWADLTLGWEAVQVATLVRRMRSLQSKALIELK